ncbi:hypothetical protein L195_g062402, partial [Trifolium pratense]
RPSLSLSEGSARHSEPHQEVTDSWRALASFSDLFAERRLSEPKRTTPGRHLLMASCSPHVRWAKAWRVSPVRTVQNLRFLHQI